MKTLPQMIVSEDKGSIMQAQIIRLSRVQTQLQDLKVVLAWVKDQLEGGRIELMNTLRWEDDGGRLVPVELPEAAPATSDDQQRSFC